MVELTKSAAVLEAFWMVSEQKQILAHFLGDLAGVRRVYRFSGFVAERL